MVYLNYWEILIGFVIISTTVVPFSCGYTDTRDVFAINDLFSALGKPPLLNWVPNGGDPCLEAWQGVECVNSNITGLILNGASISGVLASNLNFFTSMISFDLSNNQIGGSIPPNLPSTMNNLDLSNNSLTGNLPPSTKSLSALTFLHLENNQLSGTLDVLQDLPLSDLNIENNIFSGPIPEKLLTIPNFRKDGNPFNTTVILSPALAPSPLLLSPPAPHWVPEPAGRPGNSPANKPSVDKGASPAGTRKFWTAKRVVWIAGVLVCTIFLLGLLIFMLGCYKKGREADRIAERQEKDVFQRTKEVPKIISKEADTISKDENRINIRTGAILKPKEKQEKDLTFTAPPLLPSFENVIVNPTVPTKITAGKSSANPPNPPTSMRYFTVASLQQCTNSFAQVNRMGGCMLGSVYRGELSDGKLLAIYKLDTRQKDEEFLELVSNISKLRHINVVKLEGYCMEHGQQILVYEYCSNRTLHAALHFDDEHNKNLSWNSRIYISLGAARSLEYLHEVCQPSIVHGRFMSSKILLDEKLEVYVSDCGFAPLISSGSLSGELLSTCGYGSPEFEMGTYTCQSDVYSFGVVMLELLTGRKSFDRSRPRGEQFLVRWAIPQLHDIDLLARMVDPSLNGAYPAKSLSRFADIISLCVQVKEIDCRKITACLQKRCHIVRAGVPSSNVRNCPEPLTHDAKGTLKRVQIEKDAKGTLKRVQIEKGH
ncbi:hypothetical protein GIB67_025051 [Kingdonia uniflora]|uniref:Protein kinase domain-containing protein n=1 Tax=Kingdonia uniflora TaxID=39325 RepID=A0A7J7N7T0_9MAGN|nr:hypothetical protein GIB67_025051 [Kingdonia uniflora]